MKLSSSYRKENDENIGNDAKNESDNNQDFDDVFENVVLMFKVCKF